MQGSRVVGLGEALLRLAPPGSGRLDQARSLDVEVGGAELNTLIAAAGLGADAVWLTRLADNPLGRRIAAHARTHDVRPVVDWDPDARAPLYFVEHGASPRPSEVLYDRRHTAMTALALDHPDWSAELEAPAAVLSTGITCALGAGAAEAATDLLARGRAAGARTVFDVNHRSRLWSWEAALPVLRRAIAHVDVLAASRHDLLALLEAPDAAADEELAQHAIDVFGAELVLLRGTQRHGATVRVQASVVTPADVLRSATYEAVVVDPFGAGDAALGTFVAALLDGDDLSEAVDRAAWACAFHHTIPGDAPTIRPSDVDQRAHGGRAIMR